jgi:hypothetical protein
MKKIMIITRNFSPLWGGIERLNWHMAEDSHAFAARYECQIFGTNIVQYLTQFNLPMQST